MGRRCIPHLPARPQPRALGAVPYGELDLEPRRRLNYASTYNLYPGLPGDGDVLELTVDRRPGGPYDARDGLQPHRLSRSTTSTPRWPTWRGSG